jgi:uncharacterized protein (DUF1684 family)
MNGSGTARVWLAFSVVAVLTAAMAGGVRSDDTKKYANHTEEIETWIEWRLQRLQSPDGYLSVVGLYWLEEGKSTFGSDPSNDFVFPQKAPESIGTFDLNEGTVTVTVDPEVAVKHDGERVTTLVLQNDHAEGGPTYLKLGSLTWYAIKRGDRVLIRLKDTESALRKGFKGIDRFPIDERWRVEATLETYKLNKYITLASSINVPEDYRVFGELVFEIGGEMYHFDALGKVGAEQLFIIFADETSAVETYGAGRYMYVDVPTDDGKVIIDFNKAYNPPCAFNKYTTCPLPPPQNVLPIRVTAGEKWHEEKPD